MLQMTQTARKTGTDGASLEEVRVENFKLAMRCRELEIIIEKLIAAAQATQDEADRAHKMAALHDRALAADLEAARMQVLEARVKSKEQGLQATQLRCKHMQKELESLINVRAENARLREELSMSKGETLAALQHSRIMSQPERSVKSLAQQRLDERASDSLEGVTRALSEQHKAEVRSFFSEKMLTKARDQIRKLELQIASAVVKDAGYVKPTNKDAAVVAGGLHSLVEVYKGKWMSSEREIEGYKVRIRRMEIASGLLRTELEGLRVERIELVAAANAAAPIDVHRSPPRSTDSSGPSKEGGNLFAAAPPSRIQALPQGVAQGSGTSSISISSSTLAISRAASSYSAPPAKQQPPAVPHHRSAPALLRGQHGRPLSAPPSKAC
jgi:predicted DNA-binding protein (UPF0251 family)